MFHIEEEQAGVPIELATVYENLGKVALRLLGKRLHLVESFAHRIAQLDVSIARLRTGRFHTHGEEATVVGNKVQSLQHILAERLLVEHSLIGWRSHDASLRILHGYAMRSPCHTRSCIAMNGFRQDVLRGNIGQLFPYKFHILLVGIDIDMVGWHNPCHPVISLLQLSTSHTEEIKKLFGISIAAAGPQSSTLSSGEYDTIIVMIVFCHLADYIMILF